MEDWDAKQWRGLLTWWYASHERVVMWAGMQNEGRLAYLVVRES